MALVWRNYNFRIYPTKAQEILLDQLFFCTRFVYNHYVEIGRKLHESSGRYPTYEENITTLALLVSQNPFLQETDHESLPLALHNLSRAYMNHTNKKDYNPPGFKSKNSGHQSYMTKYKAGTKLISKSKINLPVVGSVRIVVHRPIARCFRPKFITVIRKPSMMYEVSIGLYAPDYLYEKEMCHNFAGERRKGIRSIGLDFSMPDLLIDSEGRSANYPHYYKQQLNRLSKEQRKLAHCKRDSKNYRKQRIRVARLMQKCANQRTDFQHKLSRVLSDQYDLVCIEDLAIKQLIAGMKLGKSAYDNGWYQFSMMLAYKLKESGGQLQKVGRWYPSSRTCSQCGRVKNNLDLAERIYRCSCGNTLSRDINAAINIKREGERLNLIKREEERSEGVRQGGERQDGERHSRKKEMGSTATMINEVGSAISVSIERGNVVSSYQSNIIQ